MILTVGEHTTASHEGRGDRRSLGRGIQNHPGLSERSSQSDHKDSHFLGGTITTIDKISKCLEKEVTTKYPQGHERIKQELQS